MKITDEYVDLVWGVTNDIVKAHGWFLSVKRSDVQTVLEALVLIKAIAKSMRRKK